jgi:LmbE family N-acetylglucosaminyl deacetylase
VHVVVDGSEHTSSTGAAVTDAPRLPVGDLPTRGVPTIDLPVPAVALAIGAHPDDVDLACGATLAKWASAGCATHHVVLTDGSKGTWDHQVDRRALVAARRGEQQAAAAILGSRSVTFLAHVDGELTADLEGRRRLCAVIRRIRPDVVIGHDPWRRYRLHPDHRHAGWLTVDAVVAARDATFHPELGLPAHRPSTVLLFEADEPNHVERVDDTLDRKVDALLAHRSQYRSTFGVAEDRTPDEAHRHVTEAVARQARQHGALAAVPLGEAFHRIAEV